MKKMHVIVETPKGSTIKYDYNIKFACYESGRMLPAGMAFPYDFGFIPGTKGEDGDPLDVIIYSSEPRFTGCVVECRIIGGIKVLQHERNGNKVRNDRFIAVPVKDRNTHDITDISDITDMELTSLEQFFINYNAATGKKFIPLDRMDAAMAVQTIEGNQLPADPVKLLQILLPLYTSDGDLIPEENFREVEKKLAEQFGGTTSYVHSPASGLWKADEGLIKDDILVIEVMVDCLDNAFWKKFKTQLEKNFDQKSIVIRHLQIGLL
jgi:inorganic pyrophosphatase